MFYKMLGVHIKTFALDKKNRKNITDHFSCLSMAILKPFYILSLFIVIFTECPESMIRYLIQILKCKRKIGPYSTGQIFKKTIPQSKLGKLFEFPQCHSKLWFLYRGNILWIIFNRGGNYWIFLYWVYHRVETERDTNGCHRK